MRALANNTVRRLRVGRRWLKHALNTCAGGMAFFSGMCLGILLYLCWVLLSLWFTSQGDRIALSAVATVLGLSTLFPASLVLFYYLRPISPPLTAYTPPRTTVVRVVVASALFTVVVLTIAFGIGGWFVH